MFELNDFWLILALFLEKEDPSLFEEIWSFLAPDFMEVEFFLAPEVDFVLLTDLDLEAMVGLLILVLVFLLLYFWSN